MHVCSVCQKSFPTAAKFDSHSCVQKSESDDRKTRLGRMLASGACSQAYYDNAFKEISRSESK